MESLCKLFGVTKQAYYKYDENIKLAKVSQEEFAVSYINRIRMKDPGIGGLKLWHMYRRDFDGNHPLGRDRFEDVIDKYGLKVRHKVRKPRTTDSTHGLPVFPNLTREYLPMSANSLWVSDITYIPVWIDNKHYDFCYLSMILDAYSEEIVGWCVGETLDTKYPLSALRMALSRIESVRKEDLNLIHHSDRGTQYASSVYVAMLRKYGIKISMTECGDPKENAKAERINSTMKDELLMGMRFHSVDEVRLAVESAVEFYNKERPHMSIDMKTPYEAASCEGEIPKRWTSYRELYIKTKNNGGATQEKNVTLSPNYGVPSGLRPPVTP